MKGLFFLVCFLTIAGTTRIADACCFGANCHCTAQGVECCAGSSCGIDGDCISDTDRAKTTQKASESSKGKEVTKDSPKTASTSSRAAAHKNKKHVSSERRADKKETEGAATAKASWHPCSQGTDHCGPTPPFDLCCPIGRCRTGTDANGNATATCAPNSL
jgi:hypothetical protein